MILDQFGNPARPAQRASRSGYAPGGFQAANWSVNRSYIGSSARDSAEDITPHTRNEIDRKARYLDKNVGMVRGVRKDFIKYVIGPGILPFANTGDAKLDEQYDEWFLEWAKICDLGGRLGFFDFQRAAVSNQFLSGDVFRVLTQTPSGYPQLRLVRSHNCGNDGSEKNAEAWHDGIFLNKHGAAARYKFLQRSGKSTTFAARSVVHSQFLEHGDEVRQVSALAGAILHIHDGMDLLALEKTAVKDNAITARVIKKEYAGHEDEDPGADPLGATTAPDALSNEPIPLQAVLGAELQRLQVGESMQSFKSERPNPTFTGFLAWLGREINASTGWRYEFSFDPSSINSNSVRQILDSCKRTAQAWQAEEIKATHRIRNFAIASAIELGELPHTPRWYKADYLPGAPDPTIDKGRDGKLDIALVKNRMLTLKDYYGARGKHWKLQLDQAQLESEIMNEMGLSFASDGGGSDITSAEVDDSKQVPTNNQK